MKRAGVIGHPIGHTLSPIIHEYWLNKNHIEGKYNALDIPAENFTRNMLERLRDKEGYVGFNITVPHKERAFEIADVRDDAARFTGAANLLVFRDGKLYARNTDVSGIQDSLTESLQHKWGVLLSGRKIVLLGAGGAARAIAYALQGLGVGKIWVLNRHLERAEKLATHVKEYRPDAKFSLGTFEDWPSAANEGQLALVINASSAGMNDNLPLPIDLGCLTHKNVAICDIVYRPLETPLLKQAREKGFERRIDGLGMLMHQAAPSFQAFFYPELTNPPTPGVTKELRKRLEEELKPLG